MTKPIIGITLDYRPGSGYSNYPWYAIRENYCTAVLEAGGVPILLPYSMENVSQYVDMIDGLLISGGDFDIDPSLYGQEISHHRVTTIPNRTKFEFELTKRSIDAKKAILGICGGYQMLNVVMGGTLIQHIPDDESAPIRHEQPNPRHEPGHIVSILSKTKLHGIVNVNDIEVNSAHHQAVDKLGAGLIPNAYAPDGIIEGIESTDMKFLMGIQWHPEFHITDNDKKIFNEFVGAAKAA